MRIATFAALALATVAAYASVWHAQFITYDDPMYVVENDHVRGGWSWAGLTWALGSGYAANWHPLTWLSHMLDAELFGLDSRWHHVTSLLWHVVNALLLLHVLTRMTRAFWPSAIVAAVFALHPTHVESVAWVSERKDVLSTTFALLTVLAYARFAEQPTRARYLATLALYALGLMAKPMLVTLPFVLLLLDAWPLARLQRGELGARVREKLPFLALALGASVTTFLVQRHSGAVASTEHLALPVRASNALVAYVRYLGKTAWPAELAVFYPHVRRIEPLAAGASLAALVALTWFAWRERRAHPCLLVGWLWFLGTLVPVIGLVQVGSQSMADRYTYIPSIGLWLGIVWYVRERWHPAPWMVAAATVPMIVAFALVTRVQAAYWRDTRTLFGHALSITRENDVANQCYGNALLVEGELDQAILHLREALRISPDFPDAHNNLGTALAAKGQLEEAIQHFHAALRTEPDSPQTHYNLAFALGNAGRFAEALPEYEQSLRLDPHQFNGQAKYGLALAVLGRFEEARVHLETALALRPDEIETRRELAIVLIRLGLVEAAIAQYRALLETSPRDLDALNNIAWIRATHADQAHRDGAEAVLFAERARDFAPQEEPVLLDTLAAAYATAGRFEDAVRACERAVALAQEQGRSQDSLRFQGHLDLFRSARPLLLR